MTSTAFQITISPQKKRKNEDNRSEDSHESCLILAPFNKCPSVNFSNVKLGTTAVRTLKVVNPSQVSLEVKFLDIPKRKCGLIFSADNFTLMPSEIILINILWAPIEHGSWHHTVKVVTDKKGCYSLRIVCNSAKIEKRNVHKPLKDHNRSTVVSKKVKKPWVSITNTKAEEKINCRPELNIASKQNKFIPAQSFNFISAEVSEFSGSTTPRRDTYILKNINQDEGKENILHEEKFKLPSRRKVPKSGVKVALLPSDTVIADGFMTSNTSVSSFDNKLQDFCFTPDFHHKKHVCNVFDQNYAIPSKQQDYSLCKNIVETTTTTTREWYNGNDSVFSFTKSTKLKEFSFSLASTPQRSSSSHSESFEDSLEVDPLTASGHLHSVNVQRKYTEDVKTPLDFNFTQRNLNTDFSENSWVDAASTDLKFDFDSYNVRNVSWPPDLNQQSTPLKEPLLKLSPIKHSKIDFKFALDTEESDITSCKNGNLCDLAEDGMNTTYLLGQEAPLSIIDEACEEEYSAAERTTESVSKKELFDDFNFSFLSNQKPVLSFGEIGIQNVNNAHTSRLLSNSPSKKQVTHIPGFGVSVETDQKPCKTLIEERQYEDANAAEESKGPSRLQAIRSEAVAFQFSPPRHTNVTKLTSKKRSPSSSVAQFSNMFGTAHKKIVSLSLKKPFKSPLKMKRMYEAALKSGAKQVLKPSTGIRGGHATEDNGVAAGGVVFVGGHNKKIPQKRVKCEEISNMAEFIGNFVNSDIAVSSRDPFLTRDVYYGEQWVDACERHFINWLNSLLMPPATLACNAESVDVVALWKQTSKQQKVDLAQSREVVSSLYNTNERLNSVRKAATLLFKSNEVVEVLSKVTAAIERKILCIRDDKALLQDVGLKQYMLKLLLCYNPLWLRIGLETIYGKNILLPSNSDVQGLTTFLVHNFLEDRYMKQKYNHSRARHMYDAAYVQAMKKFILKKFFSLVYFLDQAKGAKLIGHDPCLFNKNAMCKSSREVLLAFSREFLSAVGDITKCLRQFGYIVTHEQSYLHEFDYAVTKLLDLRDGIRLCRVMEIILKDETIMLKLRVPAVSRLQKVHNMQLAFASLISAGFDIKNNISSRDIVDGHREKTLSLLWQILLKYQLPRYEAAAVELQHWWRKKLMKIRLKNIRKIKAAITIQQRFRAVKLMKYERRRFLMKKAAAVVIQKWIRKMLPARKQRLIFIRQRKSVLVIQRWWRATILQRSCAISYHRMVASVLCIQRWYRSLMQMQRERALYQRLIWSVKSVQQRFRANRAMKQQKAVFLVQKAAAVKIQMWIRAVYMMRKERESFLVQKRSAVIIQKWYRSILSIKLQQCEYQKLRSTVQLIQQRFRANRAMKQQKAVFLVQKAAAVKIQMWIRAVYMMRKERESFLVQKRSAVIIQKWYRSILSIKLQQCEYQKLRSTVQLIQQRFRANRAMKQQKAAFLVQKAAAMKIQFWIRAVYMMRKERESFLVQKRSAVTIQQWYRGIHSTKLQQYEYQKLRLTVINIQLKYRAKLLMKYDRYLYQRKRWASIFIQRWFRATMSMKHQRVSYLTQRHSVITIQRWFRSVRYRREREMKRNVPIPISRTELENRAAVKIQALWRGFAARKQLPSNCLSLKNRCISRSPSEPVQTLQYKYINHLKCFENNSLGQMIMLFMSLTSLTDLSREICKDFSASEYLPKVFSELQRSNRSFAYQRLCSLGTQLILNLARYPENRDNIWQVADGLEIIFQLMTQSVGTQSTIFSNCCKILWLLADDPSKAQLIHGTPQSINKKKLLNFYNQEQKKITSRRSSSACSGSVTKTNSTSDRKHTFGSGCAKSYSASRKQGPISGTSANKVYSTSNRQGSVRGGFLSQTHSVSRRLCPDSHSSVNKRLISLNQLDSSFNAIKYLIEKLDLL